MNATPVYRLEKLPTQDMQSDRTVNPRPWRRGNSELRPHHHPAGLPLLALWS